MGRKCTRLLTVEQILAWADAHHARTGRWPHAGRGAVPEAPGLTWNAVNLALYYGRRGLPGGSSLDQLLRRCRGKGGRPPALAVDTIVAWAKAHHARTGRWPKTNSGPVPEAPGETWGRVNGALWEGHRGLPGGDTLAKLLDRHRWGFWTPEEDELLRTLPPAEVARRTGRTLLAVYVRCHELGLPDGLPAARHATRSGGGGLRGGGGGRRRGGRVTGEEYR
jgi:hypothetical protein